MDLSDFSSQHYYFAPDYLEQDKNLLAYEQIKALRKEREERLFEDQFLPERNALEMAPVQKVKNLVLDQDAVVIGNESEMPKVGAEVLKESLRAFIPWKKGPFEIFGNAIDSEWRSDLKWQRILPRVSNMKGKVVADIGCNNGYFMLRMANEQPKRVIGFEPYQRNWFNFQLFQKYAQKPNLHFELLGVEHMDLYPGYFDQIFCLGILYHHTDPIGLLRKLRGSLRKGGELYIDCQGIRGKEAVSLTPSGRYARARGIWFLPTLSCLQNWILRAGFTKQTCFYNEKLTSDEQRPSEWAPVKSLADFLDPSDPEKTIEGYPAPTRMYLKISK